MLQPCSPKSKARCGWSWITTSKPLVHNVKPLPTMLCFSWKVNCREQANNTVSLIACDRVAERVCCWLMRELWSLGCHCISAVSLPLSSYWDVSLCRAANHVLCLTELVLVMQIKSLVQCKWMIKHGVLLELHLSDKQALLIKPH